MIKRNAFENAGPTIACTLGFVVVAGTSFLAGNVNGQAAGKDKFNKLSQGLKKLHKDTMLIKSR